MTRRRPRPTASAPINARLGLAGLLAVVVVLAMLTATAAGLALGLELLLVGAGLCLIGAGLRGERAGLVVVGAAAFAADALFTGATTAIEWESVRPLPVVVFVVDAESGRPIVGAALAVVGRDDQGEVVAERGPTGASGRLTLLVPVKTTVRGSVCERLRAPRVELDYRELSADPGYDQRQDSRSTDGWNVAADAEGYQRATLRLVEHLPEISWSIAPALPELTIALRRRAK